MYNLITLPNGLRIVTEYIDHVNSVSVGLLVENGSRNENKKNNGISHFIEHMLFKGTKRRSPKQIAEEIENVGGQINAYTSKESTCYYVKALDTHLDLCLDILSDMIFNSSFSEDEIKKEHGVVIEEINMGEDTPEEVLTDLHAKATFKDTSLALPILGTKETVKSFNKTNLVDYLKKRYTPKNTVLSICGKFDSIELNELIDKYFKSWNCKDDKQIVYDTPKVSNDFLFAEKEIEQLHISLGLKGMAIGDKKGYGLILLANILGGGASSLLFQKIREEMGVCYSIYMYPLSYKNVGTLNIYAGLNPNFGEKAIIAINNELYNFGKKGITKEQLEINKEKIKANYILGLESTSSRMFSNGKALLFLNRLNKPEDIIKKIDSIDLELTNEILKECIEPGILNGAFVGKNIDYKKLALLAEKDSYV